MNYTTIVSKKILGILAICCAVHLYGASLTSGLIINNNPQNQSTQTVATPMPVVTPMATPVTPPVTPVVQPAMPVVTPMVTPVTPAITPVIQPITTPTPMPTPVTSSSTSSDTTLPTSPYTPDITTQTTQINNNAPVITLKIGGTFIFNGPNGSIMHPTPNDLSTKLQHDKKNNSNITSTAISSVISNNTTTSTITGVRACTSEELPYPIIIEKPSTSIPKTASTFTTIARIRVIEK